MSLQSSAISVHDILNNTFYVNRRYQRRPMLSIEDKRFLINSVLAGIPLPAILITENHETSVFEVLEGAQWLDAIVSFVLCRFSVPYNGEYCYFDPSNSPGTCDISVPDKVLPQEVCNQICDYKLQVVVTEKDSDTLDWLRYLYTRDRCQYQVTGVVSELVWKIASRVRGDYTSSDTIPLRDIGTLSTESAFWIRHGLFDYHGMQESRDEELIAALLAATLLEDYVTSVDKLYDPASDLTKKIEQLGSDTIEADFINVFHQLDLVFGAVDSSFASYLFGTEDVDYKYEYFKAVFSAFYDFLVSELTIENYEDAAKLIKSSDSSFSGITGAWRVRSAHVSTAVFDLYTQLKRRFLVL